MDKKENTENINSVDEEIESHKLLLDLMRSRYAEEERRNEAIDTKISRMISIMGVMLTLYITVFTPLITPILKNTSTIGLNLLINLFILTIIIYILSLGFFIYSILFKDFKSTPTSSGLIEKEKRGDSQLKIINTMLGNYDVVMDENKSYIGDKIKYSKYGFASFILSVILTLFFIVSFIIFNSV